MKEITKMQSDEIQSSTDTYGINKTLKLDTVNEGELTDNVLVHSLNNEVRFIPRSEFGEGTIKGTPNNIPRINETGIGIKDSNISDNGSNIRINVSTEIDSQVEGKSGLKFSKLKNEFKTLSEVVFEQDVTPTAGIDETVYFSFGNIVKKVNLDKTITDYYSFPEGCFIQSDIIVDPIDGSLFVKYFDGISLYSLVKLNQSGIVSVIYSSTKNYRYLTIDNHHNLYIVEYGAQKVLRINAVTLSTFEYYSGAASLNALGFDPESNGYFSSYENLNLIYKFDTNGLISTYATLSFEVSFGCVKPDGSLYVLAADYEDKNIYSVSNSGVTTVLASLPYKPSFPCLIKNGFLYVNNNNYDNGLVYRISPTGQVTLFGAAGKSPRYMAVTNSGIVYASNSGSYNLIKIAPQGEQHLLTLDENGNVILSDKNLAAKSDFKTINGESIVGTGNLVIGGNTGEIPTLQEVLSNGRTWMKDNNYLIIDDIIAPDSFAFESNKSAIGTTPSAFAISTGGVGNRTIFRADKPATGEVYFDLPVTKPSGGYVVATSDDLTLQKVLDTSPSWNNISFALSSEAYSSFLEISNEKQMFNYSKDGDFRAHTLINIGGLSTQYTNLTTGTFYRSELSPNNGLVIKTNNQLNLAIANLKSDLVTDSRVFQFPDHSGTLITDLAIDNLTTSALSRSTLSTSYSSAVNGFRVHCMNISDGALIYEKTSIGWVQFPVTQVP